MNGRCDTIVLIEGHPPTGSPFWHANGFIHITVCFPAGFALALITALQVLQIILKNSDAILVQASLASLFECGPCFLLGAGVRTFTELLDGVKGAPINAVLPLALSHHLLVQGINQEIVGPQDK